MSPEITFHVTSVCASIAYIFVVVELLAEIPYSVTVCDWMPARVDGHHRFLFSFKQRFIIASFDRGTFPSGNPDLTNSAFFFSLMNVRSFAVV